MARRSWRTRRLSPARGALDFDDLVRRALDVLDDAALLAAGGSAAAICSSTRSRTSTARSSAGPPPGGPGEPDLPRRRRRPVDLRLAAGRRPAGPRARRGAARAAAGRPRGQPPLPGPGRRARGPAHRAQRGALRQGHPLATGRGRSLVLAPDPADEPRGPRGSCGPAGRRRDRGDPGPDEPRAPAGGHRGSRAGRPFRAASVDLLVDDPRARRPARPGRGRRRPVAAPRPVGVVRRAARRSRRPAGHRPAGLGRGVPELPRRSSAAIDATAHGWRRSDGTTRLTLATAHSTKGAEFDHVAVVGHGRGSVPERAGRVRADDPAGRSRRNVASLRGLDACASDADPELRPGAPSPFLLEAFSGGWLAEAGMPGGVQPRSSSRMSRSMASRNGSVASGRASRIESFGP